MSKHLNLKYLDRAIIQNLDPEINGTEVKIVGIGSRGIVDMYIVEFLDGKTKLSNEFYGQDPVECLAFVVPEYCLDVRL